MATAYGLCKREDRADVHDILQVIQEEARALASAADEALRTGDWARLAELDLTRAYAVRDALLEVLRDPD